MSGKYTIGVDFGTNSVRALIVDVTDGRELGMAVENYAHGDAGIILDPSDPNLARQHPRDYLDSMRKSVVAALEQAAQDGKFSVRDVIGIGVDTTGSTPLPVNAAGQPLVLTPEFSDNPHAMAWLWKDHTSHAEAEEITAAAQKQHPEYLAVCGGRYSSEWYWAKLLRCARVAPNVFAAAHTWVEIADWIPAVLAGNQDPQKLRRGVCAAGHKGLYHPSWGGYPDRQFLASLDKRLADVRATLPRTAHCVQDPAGALCGEWAKLLGLPEGIPIAVGAFDAHLGAVGAGIAPGSLVKIMGTSTCDIMTSALARQLPDIPGLCGVVPESVLPGYYGLEAGQSAVGDIFNWFVNVVKPGPAEQCNHAALTAAAEQLRPGQSGLLALDWNNGNRTVLVDQRLTGLILGLTLHSTPGEIYRALIEATAFGARVIMERFEEYGIKVERVINCGGIAARNPVAMQIYADIMNRPLAISRSTQTCALGSAIAGAVVAGKGRGGYASFAEAVPAMTGTAERVFNPIPANVAVYQKLYAVYRTLHDAFGIKGHTADVSNVMKQLLAIRDEA